MTTISKIKSIPKIMLKTENKILGTMGHVAMSLYNGTIGNALKVEKRHQQITNSGVFNKKGK